MNTTVTAAQPTLDAADVVPLLAAADMRYRPGRVERFNYQVGTLPDGNPVFIPVQILCGDRPGPRLAAVAGVHGDELEGVKALHALMAALDPAAVAGTLVVVPVVNVLAFNACSRRSPVDNIDLNRVFPGNPTGSISERVAYGLCHSILAGCDLVVSLHGWYQNGTLEPWMEFVDVPGAVGEASHAAACAFGIADLVPLPPLPGRLISALAEMGIPAIEGEVGGQATFNEEKWRLYSNGISNVMAHLGMLPSRNSSGTALSLSYWGLRGVTAPVGGLFERQIGLGERVDQGQCLATISDLFGRTVGVVTAPVAGKIASIQTVGIAHPGGHLFTILEPAHPQHMPTQGWMASACGVNSISP
jgi:uncharacterized protein